MLGVGLAERGAEEAEAEEARSTAVNSSFWGSSSSLASFVDEEGLVTRAFFRDFFCCGFPSDNLRFLNKEFFWVEFPLGVVSNLRFFNIEGPILPEGFLSDLLSTVKIINILACKGNEIFGKPPR